MVMAVPLKLHHLRAAWDAANRGSCLIVLANIAPRWGGRSHSYPRGGALGILCDVGCEDLNITARVVYEGCPAKPREIIWWSAAKKTIIGHALVFVRRLLAQAAQRALCWGKADFLGGPICG